MMYISSIFINESNIKEDYGFYSPASFTTLQNSVVHMYNTICGSVKGRIWAQKSWPVFDIPVSFSWC